MNIENESLDGDLQRHYEHQGNRLRHAISYSGPQPPNRWYLYRDGNVDCVTSTESGSCPANAFGQTPSATLLEDYGWDQRDRLLAYSRFYDADQVTSCYRHDALDRLVHEEETRGPAHVCPHQTTRSTDFTYLGLSGSVSSETLTQSGSTTTTKAYSYGPDDERVGMTATGGVNGDFYYARNAHTDVSLLARAGNTSDPEASYVYHPYGELDALSEGDPEDAEPLNSYRFNDKRFDSGSATVDMGARRYEADVNRFLSMDSFSDSGDDLAVGRSPILQNRYVYGAANPVYFTEVDGHYPVPGGIPPPNYRRFDKALPYILDEIEDNRTSKTVNVLNDYKHRGWKKRASWWAIAGPGRAYLKAWALGSFYRNMRTHGDWDQKDDLIKILPLPKYDRHFPIRGNLKWEVFFDVWSNIHYGYIGRAADFPRGVLLHFARKNSPDKRDQAADEISINIGMDLWEDKEFDIGRRDIHLGILSAIPKWEVVKRRQHAARILQEPSNNR